MQQASFEDDGDVRKLKVQTLCPEKQYISYSRGE